MSDYPFHTYHIKNMLCYCCIQHLKNILEQHHYIIEFVRLGMISIAKPNFNEKELRIVLQENGFDIIKNHEDQIVEQIKQAVVELIHYSNNVDSIVRKSEYLVERLNMTYQQISRIFSKKNSITLERYMLLHKMERVKELVLQNNLH